jgi:hypothetical protein
VEWTLDGGDNDNCDDFYDVSLVDGFNLPMSMRPVNKKPSGKYRCTVAECPADLMRDCPASHLKGSRSLGKGYCMSDCLRQRTLDKSPRKDGIETQKACCSFTFAKDPKGCPGGKYPQTRRNKQRCPKAYSYAFNDPESTFICDGKGGTAYIITFC